MQITRETDYAIRCVLHLAGDTGRTVMVEEISGERDIPRSFLAKILQKLKRAKIVKSYRGVKGGYRLTRDPSGISLLDVIEAVQGKIALNECALDAKVCGFSDLCTVHPVWKTIRADVEESLRRHDIAALRKAEDSGEGGG
jgi:Rrf2 family protein